MGVDVVDFGLGEPDFATPDFVGRAGSGRSRRGRTKYTDVAGEPSLRDAIAAKYRRGTGRAFARENVIVTAGAKQAVFNVCQALFEEGDDVALFSPYWVSVPEMVRLSGARPVFVPTTLDSGWQATASALDARACERRPRRHPELAQQPDGSRRGPGGELLRIAEWCAARDAWLIFDETYDRFLYDGRPHVSAAAFPARVRPHRRDGSGLEDLGDDGLAPGLGGRAPRAGLRDASYQSHSTSNASSISQAAALAALTDLDAPGSPWPRCWPTTRPAGS